MSPFPFLPSLPPNQHFPSFTLLCPLGILNPFLCLKITNHRGKMKPRESEKQAVSLLTIGAFRNCIVSRSYHAHFILFWHFSSVTLLDSRRHHPPYLVCPFFFNMKLNTYISFPSLSVTISLTLLYLILNLNMNFYLNLNLNLKSNGWASCFKSLWWLWI